MNTQLFESELIRLDSMDAERDAEIESRWTHDPAYARLLSADPMRPRSPNQVKKRYEEMEKKENEYHFAIRARADDRLVGFIRLGHLEWTNGNAVLTFGIGDAADRGKGYGKEAVRLMLRYAFGELNLYRLTANVPGNNERAQRVLERAGFCVEARRREAIHRDGQRWDALVMGLLRDEWKETR